MLMHLVLAIAFLVLGHRLRRRLMMLYERTQSAMASNTAKKIMLAAAVCSICFFVRSVFWMWAPVTGDVLGGADSTVNSIVYPWFYYEVPEILPGIAMMHLIAPRPQSTSAKGQSSNFEAGAGMGKKRCCNCWWRKNRYDSELQVQPNPVSFA